MKDHFSYLGSFLLLFVPLVIFPVAIWKKLSVSFVTVVSAMVFASGALSLVLARIDGTLESFEISTSGLVKAIFTPVAKPDPTPSQVEASTKGTVLEDASARIEMTNCQWNEDGTGAVVSVLSKFQRSGVVLRWRSPDSVEFKPLQPLNSQPTVYGPYGDPPGAHSLYIQRPWGQYAISFRVKGDQAIQFSYQFEGDPESPTKEWCHR
jgi:hypothetical protein